MDAKRTSRTKEPPRVTAGERAYIVGIKNLRVLVRPGEGCWFAQGLEIGYSVEGADPDAVRRAFELGLYLTIHAHLRDYGHLNNLANWRGPEEAWKAVEAGHGLAHYSQVSTHSFPFKIEFIQAEVA